MPTKRWMATLSLLAVSSLWIVGCGDDDADPVDAGGDAEMQDAHVDVDAATPDAASADATMQDAHVLPDADVMDAASDATGMDATMDATGMDANTMHDAGTDAQTNDEDAGDELSDAGGDAAIDEFPQPIVQAGDPFAALTEFEISGAPALDVDAVGNALASGSSAIDLPQQPNAGSNDAVVRKLDSTGALLWARQLGTDGDDWASSVSSDAAGHVYVAGFSRGQRVFPNTIGTNDRGGFLAKFDAAGTHQWTLRLANATSPVGEDNQEPRVRVDASGNNVYVLTRGFLRRYNSSGDEAWTDRTTSAYDLQPWLATDTEGNVLYLGRNYGEPFYRFVRKVRASGAIAWSRQIPGGRNSSTSQSMWGSLVTDASDNVYVAGMTDDSVMGPGMGDPSRLYVRKYDTDGNALWTRLGDPALMQGWVLGALLVDAVGNTQTVLFREERLRVHHRGIGGALTSIVDLPAWPAGHLIYRYPLAILDSDAQGNAFMVGVEEGTPLVTFLARLAID